MPNFVKAARAAEIPPGSGKTLTVEGKSVALFNVDGKFYCTDNTCVHRGGPLGEGSLEGATVTCPWHGWRYDVTTGQSETNPAAKIATYEVKVEGEELLVGI